MNTQTPELREQHPGAEELPVLIEAYGPGLALWLLWLLPAVAFVLALARV
jgi:hypothetical protein